MGSSLQPIQVLAPGANLNAYISNISSIAVMTTEQERSVADRLYYCNDLEAARQLVMSHLRFVVHIARSYSGYGISMADLIQEGNLGLMKAVKRFNPEKGVRLISFAVHWIKAEIHEFILKNWRIVKIATTKAQRKLFFNLRSSKKRLSWFTQDEAERVAKDLGVNTASVYEMEGRIAGRDTSFDGHQNEDDSLGKETSVPVAPANFLEDRESDPARQLELAQWDAYSMQQLRNALSTLDERSRNILQSRWLNENNKSTLQSLANKYGISAERVRQLEKNAFKQLRNLLTGELLDAQGILLVAG